MDSETSNSAEVMELLLAEALARKPRKETQRPDVHAVSMRPGVETESVSEWHVVYDDADGPNRVVFTSYEEAYAYALWFWPDGSYAPINPDIDWLGIDEHVVRTTRSAVDMWLR